MSGRRLQLVPDGQSPSSQLQSLVVAGQVLERVNGKSISAIIKKKSWADIHYLRSMLLEARSRPCFEPQHLAAAIQAGLLFVRLPTHGR